MNKLSYSLGVSVGINMVNQGIKVEVVEDFIKGITAIIKNEKVEVSNDEVNEILTEYFNNLQKDAAEKIKKVGEVFLAENTKKEGVVTLESGLQYQIIKEGTGAIPTAESTVTTHYHGSLIDGTVFDSSIERNTPASFPVNGVIAGWTEALQLMPLGSKWKLFIPQNLAYGANGAGDKIAPYSALIFDIELLEIK